MRVLAIIPAYNEEGCIEQTVDEFKRVAPDCDYVVVNDGSSDATEEILQRRGFNHVTHPTNLGLAGGFQTVCRYALARGYDAVIQFDADGQHVPEYISAMVDRMEREDADIVVGSRFVDVEKPISARMLGSRLITALIRLTCGQILNDPTSGMRLFNQKMVKEFATRFDFGPEPDSVALLMRRGAKVSEVQVSMRERQAGESYLNAWRSISYMARTCMSILFVQWFR